MRSTPRLLAAAVGVLLAGPALAQITLSGTVSDGTSGPLTSGNVYHVVSSITLPAGSTLTVEPNVVVKFDVGRSFSISGTLLCQGTSPGSIVFTDLRDDSVGGDSNGDGTMTGPAAGAWGGLSFQTASDASVVAGITVRYGGSPGPGIRLSGSDATFTDCLVELQSGPGWDIGASSRPTLTNCASNDNGTDAFANVAVQAIPNFSGLTASGNGFDRIRVTNGTISNGQVVAITPANLLAGTMFMPTSLVVSNGGQLTLDAGTIVKFAEGQPLAVDGTLVCSGTSTDPVVFTDARDDSVGGDTNGDGPATSPAPGWWNGLSLTGNSDASVLENVRVAYGGRVGAGLRISGSEATLRDVEVTDSDLDGVDLFGTSRPTIDGLTVCDCFGSAIVRTGIHALDGISGLQLSGNGADRIEVSNALINAGESVTLRPSQGFRDVLHVAANIAVQSGGTLTIEPGTILKFEMDRSLTVRGQLFVDGTPSDRVVLTDERDDARGGDSNGDGASSSPSAGGWRGVNFFSSADGSRMSFANVEYGGRFVAGIEIANAQVTLDRCVIRNCDTGGIDFNTSTEPTSIIRPRIENCGGPAIDKMSMRRLEDIEFATGSGNDLNTILVTSGLVTNTVTVEPNNQFNGSILVRTDINVSTGGSLILQPGVVLKMGSGRRLTASSGALAVRGSFEKPMIFTSERDDSVGGDTNGDGAATAPAPGDWGGILFSSSAAPSVVVGLEARYGGFNIPTFQCFSSQTVIQQLRATQGAGDGVRIANHSPAVVPSRIAADRNAGDGVVMAGGSFDVRQITATDNAGSGVRLMGSYSGTVRDSISWNNVGDAYAGATPGRVRYSDGDPALAGSDGNIDADPLFVDAASGDYRLMDTSPCIDTGDPASPLDADSTRADMGAYFRNACQPDVFCAQSPVGPCAPTLSYDGFASLSSTLPFTLTLSDSPTNSFAILFYGIGNRASIPVLYGTVCVGGPYQRTAPVASGGNPADGPCAGTFAFDFNAYAQSGADAAIVAGSNVIGHFWYRYSAAPNGALFSAAIEMPVCP